MTKFFLPKPKGGNEHHRFQKDKKKKKVINCNESLSNDILKLLKKVHTREIQKTIRKLQEAKDLEKEKHQSHLVQLKKLTKQNFRRISFKILIEELNVEQDNVKKIASKILGTEELTLEDSEQLFLDGIQKKQMYLTQIEKFQRVRNTVNEKKHNKKEIAKLKKKKKLEMRKEEKQKEINNSEGGEMQSMKQQKEDLVRQVRKEDKLKINKPIEKFKNDPKNKRSQFRKTGRNKVIQEKRQKKKGYGTKERTQPNKYSTQDQPTKDTHQSKFERLNQGQELHPSWEAKREIKNQMFIQPFQGKKIML